MLLGHLGAACTDFLGLTLAPSSIESPETYLSLYFFLAFLCVYFLFYAR
jgi:hypothetical protein